MSVNATARDASIFVSIASYRDPDCKNTVRDLFAKASNPARLIVAVCLQVADNDDDCLLHEAQRKHAAQMRVMQVPAASSQGACWARHQVQSLFQDEDYYFQIDSHMRFAPDWDMRLIGMLQELGRSGVAKPLLSTYPLSFSPPDHFADDGIVTIHPKGFSEEGILSQRSTLCAMEQAPLSPQAAYLIGAGLVFARGSVVREVPYDPYLYFEGEEISLAVRFWTHGWDIFTPNQVIAWHDYGKRPERARHWKDQTDWGELNLRSLARIAHLLQIASTDNPDHLLEIKRYGLGQTRSLLDYERASGLDFLAHLYQGKVLPLEELAADQEAQCTARRDMFASIWVNNAWRCPETRSGNGSSLRETAALRKWLPHTLAALGCGIVADAGCGDLNWMRDILPSLRLYFGYDIVPGLIGDLRHRLHQHNNCFFTEADIVLHTLPQCDAIICRDSLTHLPLDAIMMALRRFRQSGSHYLFATTHQTGRNRWVASGAWFPLDLCAPPFNLPAPRLLLQEGGSKLLAVWACSELPE